MLRISKVLNISVVLVRDDNGEESILLGKGIGYGRKAGQEIDRQPSDRVFIPLSNPDAQPMLELFSSIPPVYLELTQEIVADAEETLGVKLSPHIYLMLTDHLHFAVEPNLSVPPVKPDPMADAFFLALAKATPLERHTLLEIGRAFV